MPDPRFFEDLGPVSLQDLIELTGAVLADPATGAKSITVAAPLGRAAQGAVSFLSDRRYLADVAATRASACFLREDQAVLAPAGCAAVITSEPQAAWARAAERLHRPWRILPGDPMIHPTAELEEGVVLSPGVVVGRGARIGAGTQIGPHSVVGPGVALGRRCLIGANVSIGCALIGDNVRILSGAVIGEAGFGVAAGRTGAIDVPQLGRVILQDGVTVGANSCIDRGAWDDTVIGENTKIDNLVQVAHSVRLGRNCALAAHTGISGSTVVGDGVQFGGRAGVADHVNIGDGARIAAAAGVMRDVPAGETWGGSPAQPVRQWMRQSAWLAKASRPRGAERNE